MSKSQTVTAAQPKSKELDPELIKMLETLKQNWVITDEEEADEMQNSHTDLTLISKAITNDLSNLPPIYTGVLKRSLRKSNYVVGNRYSSYNVTTTIKFGDLVGPAVLSQYVSQGVTSFTLVSFDISYFASPLAEASTGVSNLYYVAGEESYNFQLLPIHSASTTTMQLDEVIPVSSSIATRLLLTMEVSQSSLRKIYSDERDRNSSSGGLDAGFDAAVYFKFYANGLTQEVTRRLNRSGIKNNGFF